MTFFRLTIGFLACWLWAGNSCWTAAQVADPIQYPSYRIQRHLSAAVQPIQQTVYTEPNRLSLSPVQQSQAGKELFQPWNLSVFPRREETQQSPYRLVSDTQAVTQPVEVQKTPPPAGGLQSMLTPNMLASNTQPPKPEPVQTVPDKTTVSAHLASSHPFPILNLGRDFLNEFRPTNNRKWSQNHAVLQTASFNGNLVTVRNVRYSRYESNKSYTTQYYDATFNLDDIRTIDLIMVPFQGLSRLAHVESSFGFADGRQIGLSIEARYEENEKYDPAAAGMRQFELIYVLADERDMIRLATDVNKNDVFIYRLNFTPDEVRTMFVDALQRANTLAAKPEFYHPLTNSCITNLITHINKGRKESVPREYRTFMPGLFANYLYDLKLVATTAKTFKEAQSTAKVNWLVERYGDLEYFSAGIRQNMY